MTITWNHVAGYVANYYGADKTQQMLADGTDILAVIDRDTAALERELAGVPSDAVPTIDRGPATGGNIGAREQTLIRGQLRQLRGLRDRIAAV